MTQHHPKCLCYTCAKLPEKLALIQRNTLREMTVRGEMTGIRRHWMEEAQRKEQHGQGS